MTEPWKYDEAIARGEALHDAVIEAHRSGYLEALGDVERELDTTIEESGFMVDESDKGYTVKLCEWLKKNLSKLKSRATQGEDVNDG